MYTLLAKSTGKVHLSPLYDVLMVCGVLVDLRKLSVAQ